MGTHAILLHNILDVWSLDLSDALLDNSISLAWLLFLAIGLSVGLLEYGLRSRKAILQWMWLVLVQVWWLPCFVYRCYKKLTYRSDNPESYVIVRG